MADELRQIEKSRKGIEAGARGIKASVAEAGTVET